jgi:hypothetical protein
MRKISVVPLAVLMLAGCPKGAGDTAGPGGDTGSTAPDTFPFSNISEDWTSQSSITVSVSNTDATGFFFGMAETASGSAGWYGEDCKGSNCHEVTGGTTLTLSSVNTQSAVVFGSTTLFDDDHDGQGDATADNGSDRLTYIIQLEGGTDAGFCHVWGEDPTYYSGQTGCVLH